MCQVQAMTARGGCKAALRRVRGKVKSRKCGPGPWGGCLVVGVVMAAAAAGAMMMIIAVPSAGFPVI